MSDKTKRYLDNQRIARQMAEQRLRDARLPGPPRCACGATATTASKFWVIYDGHGGSRYACSDCEPEPR